MKNRLSTRSPTYPHDLIVSRRPGYMKRRRLSAHASRVKFPPSPGPNTVPGRTVTRRRPGCARAHASWMRSAAAFESP